MTPNPGQTSGEITSTPGTGFVGRALGDFTLQAEIGRGGMGTVFVAWQNSLRRLVAVKILNNTVGLTESAVLRFQREAQAAAQLNHQNIVPIFGQGQENGVYYYVMELVQGRNLRKVLDELRGGGTTGSATSVDETVALVPEASSTGKVGPSTSVDEVTPSSAKLAPVKHEAQAKKNEDPAQHFDRVAELIADVADALAYAHRHGVIHRDIKPHNLIMADSGRLCITDFGLARIQAEPGVTVTGEFIGSPLYMSPEQLTGGTGSLDQRTDIYSLGATLYEWLTLRPLFPGETREQVIAQILTQDVVTPRSHDPSIPIDLETICLKALEKESSRRYSDAGEMRDDLRRFMTRNEIRAKREGPVSRARRFVSRHRIGSLAIVATVATAVMGLALVIQRFSTKAKIQHNAQLQTRIADVEEQREQLEAEVNIYKQLIQSGVDLGQGLVEPLSGRDDKTPKAAQLELPAPESELALRIVPSLLDQYIQRVGKSPRAVEDQADRLPTYHEALLEGDKDRAWTLLRPRIEADAHDYWARSLRAILACERERFPLMLLDAEQLVNIRPRSVQAFWLRGLARLFNGQASAALADFAYVTDAGVVDPWLSTAQAVALGRLGDTKLAMHQIEKALANVPNEPTALFVRAELRSRSGEVDLAISDLSKMLAEHPDDYRAYILRAELYEKQEKYALASKDYGKAANLNGSLLLRLAGKMLWMSNKAAGKQSDSERVKDGLDSEAEFEVPDGSATPGVGERREGRRRG